MAKLSTHRRSLILGLAYSAIACGGAGPDHSGYTYVSSPSNSTSPTINTTTTATTTTSAPSVTSGFTLVTLLDPSKCLDVYTDNPNIGTSIDVYNCNATASQSWQWTNVGQLQAYSGKMCLSLAPGAPKAAGTPLLLEPCDGSNPAPQWDYVAGQVQLDNTPLCVGLSGSDTALTTTTLVTCDPNDASQSWVATDNLVEVTRGIRIASAGSGLCLDISGGNTVDGTGIFVAGCDSAVEQQWQFIGNQFIGLGKCVDLPNAAPSNGAQAVISECMGSVGTQQWHFVRGSIVLGGTDQCLDASGTTPQSPVQLANCTGHTSQQWTLGQ